MRSCWNRQTGTFEGRVSLTYGFKSHLPHQTLKNGSITKVEPFLFLILKIKYGIYSKTAAAATEFSQVLCENKKTELLNFLEILEELDKKRKNRQTNNRTGCIGRRCSLQHEHGTRRRSGNVRSR